MVAILASVPELPEVETIVCQLAPRVEGRRLDGVEVLDPRWSRPLAPVELTAALRGRTVERLWRRGKYLVWDLGELSLLVHLRMTGSLLYDAPEPAPHTRARLELDDGHRVLICDPRRVGTAELTRGGQGVADFFAARLGVEPLGPRFTDSYLRAVASGRRAPVKAFLLDQRRIAGVGNV